MSKNSRLITVLVLAVSLLLGMLTVGGFAYRKELTHCVVKTAQWEVGLVKHLFHPSMKSVDVQEPSSSTAAQRLSGG